MHAKVIPFPQDAVALKDGHPVTTSLKVAEVFGKQHKNVLQSIKELDCSEEFARLNFQPGSYLDANNQPRPMFEVTRDGFTLLGMGFTGPQAARFKEAFIRAFNQMEAALRSAPAIDQAQLAELVRQAVAAALPQSVSTEPRKQVMVDAADYELLKLRAERGAARKPFSEEEKTTMRVLRAQKWSFGQIGSRLNRSPDSVADFFRRERLKQAQK